MTASKFVIMRQIVVDNKLERKYVGELDCEEFSHLQMCLRIAYNEVQGRSVEPKVLKLIEKLKNMRKKAHANSNS